MSREDNVGRELRDRLSIYDWIGSRRKVLAVFDGGSHSVFTDRSLQ